MKQFYQHLCRAEAFFARAFLIVMVVLIFGAGMARLAHSPINWAIDVATCLFAWACLFCADIAWRSGKLMSVEILTERLPARAQRVCRMANYVILMVFLSYVIVAGFWLSYVSRARAFQGIPSFSYSWVTMSMPVGAILLMITTVLKVRAEFRVHAQGNPRS